MLLLAIDTSAIASAALILDGELLESFATEDTRSHAEVLASGIEGLLKARQRPDAIAVGTGPGPFTGLRSGIATARTLSYVWQVPLAGVMSLDALAWDVVASFEREQRTASSFIVATDARRKEVYWSQYAPHGGLLEGPRVGAVSELPERLPVYGYGAGLYAEALADRVVPEFSRAQPQASSLGLFAAHQLAAGRQLPDTTPLYLRESDAQVPGPRKRAL
ncbi:tRNA (adenosine(37)-N6)-threonylcarbamoyltransferase complex dimerization subunit type 1 TsaB [Psychromicrobium sp. YIM B11713]|uniref:tRNA (adenosine(37)-N6)-threonylcarbamoyltransferase complex dimerization subunit type 1 TsaB n=1 Tax=Psychromicrobium sp. YIM B11713 TaxID=3145233 RepID=UPI00374FBA7C